MKQTGLLILSILLIGQVIGRNISKQLVVNFDTDKFELKEKSLHQLDSFFRDLDLEFDYTMLIYGHTDNRASILYNNELSIKRARTVKDYFVEHGIASKDIQLHFLGEEQPLVQNSTEENMATNRRVVVNFVYTYFDSQQELLDSLQTFYTNTFHIDPELPNHLVGKHGMVVDIPANAFVDPDGNTIKEEIKLDLVESMDYLSFISFKLQTRSDESILESGGMFKLTASDALGNQLLLSSSDTIRVEVPSQDLIPDMEKYVSVDGDNWQPTNESVVPEASKVKDTIKTSWFPNFHPMFYFPNNSTKPKKPIYPSKPGIPHAPRWESYEKKITVWNYLNKESILEKSKEQFAQAQEDYENRVIKYESYMKKYDALIENYWKNHQQYLSDLSAWEAKIKK